MPMVERDNMEIDDRDKDGWISRLRGSYERAY